MAWSASHSAKSSWQALAPKATTVSHNALCVGAPGSRLATRRVKASLDGSRSIGFLECFGRQAAQPQRQLERARDRLQRRAVLDERERRVAHLLRAAARRQRIHRAGKYDGKIGEARGGAHQAAHFAPRGIGETAGVALPLVGELGQHHGSARIGALPKEFRRLRHTTYPLRHRERRGTQSDGVQCRGSQAIAARLGRSTRNSRIAWVRVNATGPVSWPIQRMRSSAPCRMMVAASLSMTCGAAAAGWHRPRAACARPPPSTAARPTSRIGSSHSALRFRAKARVACTRGPAVPSRLVGRPEDEAADLVLGGDAQQLGRVLLEFGAADDVQRRGDGARDIGKGQPQRLGAGVDADERHAGR